MYILSSAPCKGNSLIIRLLPLQGVGLVWRIFTQGVALGYVLLPLRGVLLVSFDTLSTKQAAFMCSVGALLGWCTSCPGKRQSRAETSAPLKYHRKTTNISEIIRNFAASVVESKLLDFCNTEAS